MATHVGRVISLETRMRTGQPVCQENMKNGGEQDSSTGERPARFQHRYVTKMIEKGFRESDRMRLSRICRITL